MEPNMNSHNNGYSPERSLPELAAGSANVAWFQSKVPGVEVIVAQAAASLPFPALDVLAGIADDGDAEAVFELGSGSWQAITALGLVDIATFGPDLTDLGQRVARLALEAIRTSGLKSFSSLVPPVPDPDVGGEQ
jgi:hypothetical protein